MKKILGLVFAFMLILSSTVSTHAAVKPNYNKNDVTKISNLSEKQIKDLLPAKMKELSKELYSIEHSSRPINALFLSSVIRVETGNGTSYSYRVKNNIGGVRGSRGYRTFKNKVECLRYMQDFLYRGYINKGRKSVASIGQKYSASGRWASMVGSIANNTFRKILSLA